MGSKKKIKELEPVNCWDLTMDCVCIGESVVKFEKRLRNKYSEVFESTTGPHLNFQEAWYNFIRKVREAIGTERIRESEPAKNNPYTDLAPNFLKYLKRFGEAGLSSCVINVVGEETARFERSGIFLKNYNESKLLGLLDVDLNDEHIPQRISYAGYVPIEVPEEEFFGCPVYHLSVPDLRKGNFAYVRLDAKKRADGSYERADRFADRGIEFP